MVLRLILWLVTIVGAGGVTTFAIYLGVTGLLAGPGGARARRRLGVRNARAISQKLLTTTDETCKFCSSPIDPNVDCYDPKIGWYHHRDLETLLKGP